MSPSPTAAWRLFAVAAPGLEQVVHDEARGLEGVRSVRLTDGGVLFEGDFEVIWRANLTLRTATRVLARLGEVEARDFRRLRHEVARLPWSLVAAGPAETAVSATTHRCRLHHTGAIAERVILALEDALGPGATLTPPPSHRRQARGRRAVSPVVARTAAPPSAPAPKGQRPPLTIYVRGVHDRFTVSIDTSGELLHRRGWRTEAGKAPLRETLAAGMVALAGWEPTTPLVDPLCGAGTIVLEAAALARRRAPGLGRAFAFEAWPGFDPQRYEELRTLLARGESAAPMPVLVGCDRDPAVVAAAQRNAERAAFADDISWAVLPVSRLRPPPVASPGLVLCNPPYGRRLGSRRRLEPLYASLGRVLRSRFRGWRAGVVIPTRALAQHLRLQPVARFPLSNGGLQVTLHLYQL